MNEIKAFDEHMMRVNNLLGRLDSHRRLAYCLSNVMCLGRCYVYEGRRLFPSVPMDSFLDEILHLWESKSDCDISHESVRRKWLDIRAAIESQAAEVGNTVKSIGEFGAIEFLDSTIDLCGFVLSQAVEPAANTGVHVINVLDYIIGFDEISRDASTSNLTAEYLYQTGFLERAMYSTLDDLRKLSRDYELCPGRTAQ